MASAVYPGSFDPITFGHIDIIKRLCPLYDEFIVLVANSKQKSYLFDSQERAQLIRDCLRENKNVSVEVFDGLTVDYMKSKKVNVIIRGLRAVSDFEYEMAMSNVNKKMNPQVETLIAFTSPEYSSVSSRMVKEVAQFGGELKELVPSIVATALKEKVKI